MREIPLYFIFLNIGNAINSFSSKALLIALLGMILASIIAKHFKSKRMKLGIRV